ncbi:MAG: helix-turn-helix transcriptional regulator [Bacteroidaceae bacterium]|nr:helix-turn-helix transcriptional regulator [Bacteroidaceae bacterium]
MRCEATRVRAPFAAQRTVHNSGRFFAYAGNMILQARKEAKITQSELAARANVTKSYISRVENGFIEPGVSMFYCIMEALGMRIEIVKSTV